MTEEQRNEARKMAARGLARYSGAQITFALATALDALEANDREIAELREQIDTQTVPLSVPRALLDNIQRIALSLSLPETASVEEIVTAATEAHKDTRRLTWAFADPENGCSIAETETLLRDATNIDEARALIDEFLNFARKDSHA